MYSLFNYLTMLIIVSSFLNFPRPRPIDARQLASNGFFSVDLIHRNSPLSPFYNSSRTPLGSLSHHHRVSLSSTYYDSKDVQTDVIIPNGGDYLMKIVIGTPPVEFTAVADTGSDLVWIQCAPCQRCIDKQYPLFDPTKSTTYHAIPCTSRACNQPGISASCQSQNNNINDNSCTYSTQYGDGTKSKGVLNTETISFSSSEPTRSTFPSFIFGCGYNQEGELGTGGNGIVGLGAGPLSLVSQLSPKINYKFSYCLTPEDSGVNSKLNFGLDITTPGAVSTPFTTQDSDPTFYYLTLDGITVGGSLVNVATDVIIDSGSTLTYLPSSVYDNVRAALRDAISVSTVADPDQVFDPCYETGSLGEGFSPPNVVVHFRGADMVLKAENIFRTVDKLTCLAMVPTDDTPIFGNIAQVNFEVEYDLHAKQVSFAAADCTKY